MLWPILHAIPGLIFLGKVKLFHNFTEQVTWLRKVIPLIGTSFDLFDFDWFGSWGQWLQTASRLELSSL